MKHYILCIIFLVILNTLYLTASPQKPEKKDRFYITAGYGFSGSFFVRSYSESSPIQSSKNFYKKNFIGEAKNFTVGLNLNRNYTLYLGINFQTFRKKIKFEDYANPSTSINFDHDIYHKDYMWLGGIGKKILNKKNVLIPSIGIFYSRSKQNEIDIYPINGVYFVENVERNYKNSGLEEAGAFVDFSYEYTFQPKVNLGIKTQFYYNISSGTAESITLLPYIKVAF